MSRAILLLTLTACGMSEEDYAAEWSQVTCEVTFECAAQESLDALGWATVDDCVASAAQDGGEPSTPEGFTCEYDKDAAADCIDTWTAVTCAAYPASLPVCSPYTCTAD